jgi:multidrug efflux pump subunit AcrA (membrane-fusion protein)
MPVWRALGKSTKLFRGRTLPKTLAVMALLIGLVAFLCFWPADFKLKGDGELKPTERQKLWAEVDGYVKLVNVKHDQEVKKGDILVEQESPDLDKEIAALRGDLGKNMEDKRATQDELRGSEELTEIDESQKESHIAQLSQTIAAQQEELRLLNEKKERLKVVSPMDGRIITWGVEKRIGNRPVSRGEELLEVADLSSTLSRGKSCPWSLFWHSTPANP